MVDNLLNRGVGAVGAMFERVLGAGFDAPDAPSFAPAVQVNPDFGPGVQLAGNPFGDNQIQVNPSFGPGVQVSANPFDRGGIQLESDPFGTGGGVGIGNVSFGDPVQVSGNPFQAPYTPPSTPTPGAAGATGQTGTPGATGVGATGADPGTDKWRGLIDEAAGTYGIDGDAIQAVMMIESGGNPNARSPAGAMGLMQVMGFHFGSGEDPMDPRTNVMKGAKILADNYKRYGNWDSAVAAYLGAIDAQGRPTSTTDVLGTSGIKYAEMFNANMQKIKSRRQQAPTGGGSGGTGMKSIWGGVDAEITQEIGETPYSRQNPYNYGADFGYGSGHHGLDIGLRAGTNLYAPVGGTVIIAGGSGYYKDDRYGNAPGTGELRIRLDDGREVILGHMGSIGVRVGDRVNAGQLVGQSGTAGGQHLHLETRVRDSSLNSGWRAVDPRTFFG